MQYSLWGIVKDDGTIRLTVTFMVLRFAKTSGTALVCVYVCVSVCVISTALTDEPILMKLYTNNLEYICECRFLRFWKFRI